MVNETSYKSLVFGWEKPKTIKRNFLLLQIHYRAATLSLTIFFCVHPFFHHLSYIFPHCSYRIQAVSVCFTWFSQNLKVYYVFEIRNSRSELICNIDCPIFMALLIDSYFTSQRLNEIKVKCIWTVFNLISCYFFSVSLSSSAS